MRGEAVAQVRSQMQAVLFGAGGSEACEVCDVVAIV